MVEREELGALGIAQPKGGDKGVLRWVGCERGLLLRFAFRCSCCTL